MMENEINNLNKKIDESVVKDNNRKLRREFEDLKQRYIIKENEVDELR